jgi:hypothetical protein
MAEHPGDLAHDLVEEVKSLEHEAAEGASARTPAIVLSGITVVVGAVVVTVLVVALLAYYLTK